MADVVAIILNYKRSSDTIECVDALQRTLYPALKIIVVDNASPDGSIREIQSAFPALEIVNSGRNGGYAGGMNFGIKLALELKPEYLFLANSDTVVERDVIATLVAVMAKNPKAAAVTGTIRYHDAPERIWCADGDINFWRASTFYRTELPARRRIRNGGVVPVTFISGCAFLVRASALHEAGIFDERFFMYLEDSELCSRFIRKGFELLYVPSVTILHKANGDKIMPLLLYYSVRNRFLFLKVAAPPIARSVGRVYLGLVLTIKMIVWLMVRRDLAKSAFVAIMDYMKGLFGQGHGLVLNTMIGKR
jgi:GT2 family glycosyltransferase